MAIEPQKNVILPLKIWSFLQKKNDLTVSVKVGLNKNILEYQTDP